MLSTEASGPMSGAILISIHPEHADSIISGEKVFEYRKVLPRRQISHMVLYCTVPVKKITAIVEVKNCLIDSLQNVWDNTSHGSGITLNRYMDYYAGKQNACVLALGKVQKMRRPMALSDLPGRKTYPQLFYYLDDDDIRVVKSQL